MKDKYLSPHLLLFFLFVIILMIQLKVPLISDDFAYLLKGGSFESLYKHYIGWSGRLVADSLSSNILYYLPHSVYSTFNVIILLGLVALISYIPFNYKNIKINTRDFYIVFIIIFSMYWLYNPRLGDTTLWIVGSINYTWTAFIVYTYINLLIHFSKYESLSLNNVIILCVMGFLAGCTNEGGGWITSAFTFFYIIHKKKYSIFYLWPLITSTIGYFLLVFSPGNSIRAKHQAFKSFEIRSWANKIDYHLTERIPSQIDTFFWVFLVIILLIVVYYCFRKKSDISNNLFLPIFFTLSFLLSLFIFVVSPIFGGRGLNPSFCMLLVVISCFLFYMINSDNNMKKFVFLLSIALSINFSYSFFLINQTFNILEKQNEVRNELIDKNKDTGDIYIPRYYIEQEWVNNIGDIFNLYHSPDMSKYYGVKSINLVNVNFDYSALIENDKTFQINYKVAEDVTINKAIIYHRINKKTLKKQYYVVYELTGNPVNYKIYIHGNGNNIKDYRNNSVYDFYNMDIGNSTAFEMDGKYYVGRKLSVDFNLDNLKKFSIGLF